MSLETQAAGRGFGELELVRRAWRGFGDLEEPKKDDAKMI